MISYQKLYYILFENYQERQYHEISWSLNDISMKSQLVINSLIPNQDKPSCLRITFLLNEPFCESKSRLLAGMIRIDNTIETQSIGPAER